ncbi:hypothetical protein ACVBGC_01085 [Burkholderia stagnalis]
MRQDEKDRGKRGGVREGLSPRSEKLQLRFIFLIDEIDGIRTGAFGIALIARILGSLS